MKNFIKRAAIIAALVIAAGAGMGYAYQRGLDDGLMLQFFLIVPNEGAQT